MTENHQPEIRDLRGLWDEFAVLIVAAILEIGLEIFLKPFPYPFLALLTVLCIGILWLRSRRRLRDSELYRVRWRWAISFTIGLILGATVVWRGPAIVEAIRTVLSAPAPIAQHPCPSLPETLPALAPITMSNVSDMQELDRMNVSSVVAVTLSSNGQWLAVATRQGVCWYEWKTMRGNFQLFQTSVTSARFSLDGRLLALGNIEGTVGIWDMQPEGIQVRWRLPAHEAPVTSLAFSPDSQWLASAGDDRTVRLWEIIRAEQQHVMRGHDTPVNDLAFSLDGRLALGSRSGTVALFDTRTFTITNSMTGHGASVTTLAFGPRGEQLASGSEDKTIRLWDTVDGFEVRRFGGHTGWVLSVAFSPDGRLLVSGGEDSTIRLWELDTGAQLRTLEGHTAGVYSVAFSPDGNLLISGSGDGTVRLWGVPAE